MAGRDDDVPVGRLLSRRELLAALGLAGAALAAPAAAPAGARGGWAGSRGHGAAGRIPACVARPEQTEGPYFVDERLNRADIRSDPSDGSVKDGALLGLTILVSRLGAGRCEPLPGALVDLWQCDAAGAYSDVRDAGGRFDTRGKKFLRGYQVTDPAGRAEFRTIYPGWYPGRTVHLHFKIRTDPGAARGFEFTSQLYFDDELTDRVHARAPYAARGARTTRNERDGIFRRGGNRLMLDVMPSGSGYAASFEIGLAMT